MKKYRHLFFDLDGTLWDLRRNSHEALTMLFDKYSANVSGIDFEKFFRRYHYHNDKVWAPYREGKIEKDVLRYVRFERAFSDCDFSNDEFIRQFSDEFLEICPNRPHTLEGAHEVLEYCRDRYQLHIITNGFIEVQGHKMTAAKLHDYFTHVINSEHCGVRKPFAGIFKYAMEKTGARPEESLMIGDDWDADILGARDFGMDQAFLTTTDEMMNKMNLQNGHSPLRHNYRATYTISSLRELIKII